MSGVRGIAVVRLQRPVHRQVIRYVQVDRDRSRFGSRLQHWGHLTVPGPFAGDPGQIRLERGKCGYLAGLDRGQLRQNATFGEIAGAADVHALNAPFRHLQTHDTLVHRLLRNVDQRRAEARLVIRIGQSIRGLLHGPERAVRAQEGIHSALHRPGRQCGVAENAELRDPEFGLGGAGGRRALRPCDT